MTGFRLIPAINGVQSGIIQATASIPSAQDVIGDIKAAEKNVAVEVGKDQSELPSDPTRLMLHDVRFRYPKSSEDVLKGVELDIPFGSSLGIVGPSGAGKSTLIDILLGLSTPTSGRVSIDGTSITEVLSQWRGRVGYVPQRVALFDGTIAQNVALTWDSNYDRDRVTHALEMAQLSALVAERADGIDTRIGERGVALSGGQQQRLGIARALYADPSSSCSTRRRARWTPRPKTTSPRRSVACRASSPSSRSRTGCPPSRTTTGCATWRMAGSSASTRSTGSLRRFRRSVSRSAWQAWDAVQESSVDLRHPGGRPRRGGPRPAPPDRQGSHLGARRRDGSRARHGRRARYRAARGRGSARTGRAGRAGPGPGARRRDTLPGRSFQPRPGPGRGRVRGDYGFGRLPCARGPRRVGVARTVPQNRLPDRAAEGPVGRSVA
ncbi:ATP-binding cassette domain-containing protein [Oerskovia sp. M15]